MIFLFLACVSSSVEADTLSSAIKTCHALFPSISHVLKPTDNERFLCIGGKYDEQKYELECWNRRCHIRNLNGD